MKNGLFGLFELLFSGESCWVASKEGSNKDKIAVGSEISVEKQNFQGGMKAQVRLHENFMPARVLYGVSCRHACKRSCMFAQEGGMSLLPEGRSCRHEKLHVNRP